MPKDSRGSAGLLVIVSLLLLVGVYLIIANRDSIQAELFQQKVRSKSIALQEAMRTLELNDSLDGISLSESKEYESKSPKGETYTISLEPLFQDTEEVTDIIEVTNNKNDSNNDDIKVTRPVFSTDGKKQATEETVVLKGYKFVGFKETKLKSERFTSAVVLRDRDGTAFSKTPSDNGKPVDTEVIKPETLVKSTLFKGDIVEKELTNFYTSSKRTKDIAEAVKVRVSYNGKPIHTEYFEGYDKDTLSDGTKEELNAISFQSKLPSTLTMGDLVSYEYLDKKDNLIGVSNYIQSTGVQLPTAPPVNTIAKSEKYQVILNDGSSLSSTYENESIELNADKLSEDKDLYNNIEFNYTQELACHYREHLSPISYFTRADGTTIPTTLDNPNKIDMYINSDRDFELFVASNSLIPTGDGGKARQGTIEYVKSPCKTVNRTTAYDGLHLYSDWFKGSQSFINGFNTLNSYNLRMFSGLRASTIINETSKIDYTENKLDPKAPYNNRLNGDYAHGDKYWYQFDSTSASAQSPATVASSRNKLYCEDYRLTNSSGSKVFPYLLSERTFLWANAIQRYQDYINNKVREYNTAMESAVKNNTAKPVWSNYYMTFENFLKQEDFLDSSGNEKFDIPCIGDLERNTILVQYKPKVVSSSEITYNIINNVSGDMKIKVVSDVNNNHLDQVEKEYSAGYTGNMNNTNDASRRIDYKYLTEKEAVKDWMKEMEGNEAKLVIADDPKQTTDGADSKGGYSILEPIGSESTTAYDSTTKEVTLTYTFPVPSNFERINLSDLRTDKSSLPEFHQVWFHQYLENSTPKRLEITSNKLTKAYFKLKVTDSEGRVVKEDYVEISGK